LLDLVYNRKLSWQGFDFLTDGLRIDADLIRKVPLVSIEILFKVYKGKREQTFIKKLLTSL